MANATEAVKVMDVQHGTELYGREVDLRYKVLREPLGLSFSKYQLLAEVKDIHIIAMSSADLVGCLVLSPINTETVQMRQVAVDPQWQSKGVGRLLVAYSEAIAVERGWSEMMLHARETAVPFYLKLGYTLRGEPFTEVTIPHREMYKVIRR